MFANEPLVLEADECLTNGRTARSEAQRESRLTWEWLPLLDRSKPDPTKTCIQRWLYAAHPIAPAPVIPLRIEVQAVRHHPVDSSYGRNTQRVARTRRIGWRFAVHRAAAVGSRKRRTSWRDKPGAG